MNGKKYSLKRGRKIIRIKTTLQIKISLKKAKKKPSSLNSKVRRKKPRAVTSWTSKSVRNRHFAAIVSAHWSIMDWVSSDS